MKLDVSRWIPLGLRVMDAIPRVMEMVEVLKKGHSGQEKREAAIRTTRDIVGITEDAANKDVLNDPQVEAAVGAAMDAFVNVQNVIAAVKASKVKP